MLVVDNQLAMKAQLGEIKNNIIIDNVNSITLDDIDFGSIAQYKNIMILENDQIDFKQKEQLVNFTNKIDNITKESSNLAFFKNDFLKSTSNIGNLMEKFDYDESKYIQSLDLKTVKIKLFENLETSLKNIHKVNKIRSGQIKQTDHQNAENQGDIADQINSVPFYNDQGLNEIDDIEDLAELEFNFDLIENMEHSMKYLHEFDNRFGIFVEHLVQISSYMQNKEYFYHRQIDSLGKQLVEAQNKNDILREEIE